MLGFGKCKKVMKILSKYWPYIFIVVFWFIFSSPYFISGRAPFASDYQVNFFAPWSAHSELAGPVKNNAMPDVIGQIYPWKKFTIDVLKTGQLALWNPYSFSGTPHLANYQSAVLSPFNLMFLIMPFKDAWSILVLLQPLLAGLFMMLLLRFYKLSNFPSLIGSLSFMFCGFMTTWMGYATLGYAILFLPLALFFIEKYLDRKKKVFLFLFALTFPLSFFSGHFQISLYFLLFVFAYLVFKLISSKNRRNVIELLVFLVFGILLSSLQLEPSISAYLLSFRSEIFQKTEIIPWGYIPTFIAPDIFGNPVTRNDWFGHYAEWNAYIGLIPFVLALYAVIQRIKPIRIFFLLMALLSLMFSFQGPVLDLLVALKIPVLSTSAASRIIVLFSFSMIALAAFGFEDLVNDLKNRKINKALVLMTFVGFIFAAIWYVILAKLFIPVDKISIARQNLILPTVFYVSFFLLILTSFLSQKVGKERFTQGFVLLVIMITAFDLLRFATKWQTFQNKDLIYKDLPITDEFKKLSDVNRSFGNFGAEVGVYYHLPLVEGYDAIYSKRYGELIASIDDGRLQQANRSTVNFPRASENATKAANLLGVKYIIHKISDGQAGWTFPIWKNPQDFSKIYDDGKYQIYENKKAFPRAFLVGEYKVASNDQEAIDLIMASDLRETVILEEDPKLKLSGIGMSNAHIVKYSPNHIRIETTSDKDNLLFLSDEYRRGWTATLDGKESKVYRTNYIFRSVFVPKGKHVVEFQYLSQSLREGLILTLSGVVGIVIYFFLSSQNFSSLSSKRFFAKKKR